MKDRKRYLLDFELISNTDDGQKVKPDAKILQGNNIKNFQINFYCF